MKKLFILPLALAVSVIFAPNCQKSPSSPLLGETTEKPSDVPSSARTDCDFDCTLTLYVEVTSWSTVSNITVTYNAPGTNNPGIVVFTSLTPEIITVCAEPGTVTLTVNGGPATAYAKSEYSSDTNHRIIYVAGTNVSCSATLAGNCTGANPWGTGGTCGISVG